MIYAVSAILIGDPYGHPSHEVTSLRIFGSRKSWAQRWNGLESRVLIHTQTRLKSMMGFFCVSLKGNLGDLVRRT